MAKWIIKFICMIIVVFISLSAVSVDLSAQQMPYEGYTYDFWGKSVPSRAGYIPDQIYYAEDLGINQMQGGEDLFVYQNFMYLLDSVNNAVYALDKNYKVVRTIDRFTDKEGNEYKLNNPTGIFIKDDKLYIADKGNGRIIKCNFNGEISTTYERPISELIDDTTEFKPTKVLIDSVDNCYAICEGVYEGLINYNANGSFAGFFGGNEVQISFSTVAALFWKKILSREQAQNMIRFVPVELTNAYISGDFIYTITKSNTNSVDEIQKLNPIGNNVLHFSVNSSSYAKNNFGDVETAQYKQTLYDSQLIDINVDEDGIITALDFERGRLFQYDQECNIVSIFGNKGNQKGTFINPTALEKFCGAYVVLDKEKGCLTTFKETEYMGYVREGIRLYQKGLYEESIGPWKKVLSLNTNYQIAYLSIGRALYQQNNYKEALKYLRLSKNRKDYSQAFRAYRTEIVKRYFIFFVLGFILMLIVLVKFIRFAKRKLGVDRKKVKLIFD